MAKPNKGEIVLHKDKLYLMGRQYPWDLEHVDYLTSSQDEELYKDNKVIFTVGELTQLAIKVTNEENKTK